MNVIFFSFAWTIAECRHCRRHMGWRFTAVKAGLIPTMFWGLTRSALKPSVPETDDTLLGLD